MDQTLRSKDGKVALVTGAAGGIGRAFSMRLAAEGASVIAVDREDAAALVAELKDAGAGDAAFFQTDIAEEVQVESMTGAVLERFGRCDILVNNAGVVPHGPLGAVTLADWRRTMAINVDSMFLISRALLPRMVERQYGRIVNVTSDTLGSAVPGFAPYMASKGAVVGFTRALANEFGAHGVIANCIAPGLTRTPRTEKDAGPMFDMVARMQAIKRTIAPDDLIGALSFLTSDDAAFVTGQTLIVDGGLLKVM